jgi:hypothetical protein
MTRAQTVAAFAVRPKDASRLERGRDDLAGVVHPGPGTGPRLGVGQPPRRRLATHADMDGRSARGRVRDHGAVSYTMITDAAWPK